MDRPFRDALSRNKDGAMAVEFALVGPLLILLLMGIVVYGGWFWLAQGVQSLASEAARAALAGLDSEERQGLARAHVVANARALMGVDPTELSVVVETTADAMRVVVIYDASDHPLLALSALIPSPPKSIQRAGVVRTGGW